MPYRVLRYAVLQICLTFLISGCANNSYQIVETSQSSPKVSTQIISLNNCLGTANTEQIVERRRDTSVEGTGNLGIDVNAAKASVEAKYSESSSASTSQKLTAPPGTNMEFELEWKEQSWIGVIRNQYNQNVGRYEASIPVEVRLVRNEDLECKSAKGHIDSVNAQYDIVREGQEGILINVKFGIDNRKHMPISVSILIKVE